MELSKWQELEFEMLSYYYLCITQANIHASLC